jgi:hypothetical protein
MRTIDDGTVIDCAYTEQAAIDTANAYDHNSGADLVLSVHNVEVREVSEVVYKRLLKHRV